jgi:hypothetical protein
LVDVCELGLLTAPALLYALAWRRGVLRSSSSTISPKFGKNNFLKGAKFIADSSTLANVVALYNREEVRYPST